jgi:Domain of unknown function (DUF5666)
MLNISRRHTMNRLVMTMFVLATLLLNSCGGSSATQVAGIDGTGAATGIAYGPITSFGSIFLNGIEYSTANAQITVDDQSGTESQLYVGELVTIDGVVNSDGKTGKASHVTFSGDIAGPVTQINVSAGTFVVLGQTVLVTGSTLFDDNIQPAGVTGLHAGTLVEVSGFRNAAGQVVASRVQLEAAGASMQVKGVVQSLDTNAHTFQLNTLVVDYGSAMVSGTLANGSEAKVKGSGFTAAGALLAGGVQVSHGLGGTAAESGQIEGLITSFTSNASFVVNSQRVTTTASTTFNLKGITLAVNVHIEVEGTFDSSGTLVATSVEARPDDSAMVTGLVESVTAATNALSILGVTVTTRSTTEFQDKSVKPPPRLFNLSNVQVGDYVEVRGTASASAGLEAKVLVREKPDKSSYLQGIATSVNSPNLTVLGVTVFTTAQTVYTAANGTAIDAATFFSQGVNKMVRITGTVVTGTFTAAQVQIEAD